MMISRNISAFVVAIALVLALIFVPGCSESTPEDEAVSESVTSDTLGPYPMNVGVSLGTISLTLESVRILAPDSLPAPFIWFPASDEDTKAPVGSRFVDVTVRVEGADSKYSTGGVDVFDGPFLVADGDTIPVGERATEIDEAFSFAAKMEFTVPNEAESAILHLPLSVETSEVATFRLW